MRPLLFAPAVLCLLSACAGEGGPRVTMGAAPIAPAQDFQQLAKPADAAAIAALPRAWRAALARVRPALVRREGVLLEPDAARDYPALSPGSYNCRLVQLGDRAGRARLRSFPANFCYIGAETPLLSFTKQTGSDLPAGYLYADERRYVLLGARQRRAGQTGIRYGQDAARDVAGVVERIGPFRWRLVIPVGGQELDVWELTPVPVERQGSEASG